MKVIFGEILKKKRIKEGYSLRALAHKVGISFTCFSHYESGSTFPMEHNLIKICKILRIDNIEYLKKMISKKHFENWKRGALIRHGPIGIRVKQRNSVIIDTCLENINNNGRLRIAILKLIQNVGDRKRGYRKT